MKKTRLRKAQSPIVDQHTLQFLKQVPLFAQFKQRDLELLLQASTQQTFAAGQVIIRENDVGEEFFLVLEGQVEVRKGHEPLAVLNQGQFFGEMVFLDDAVRSADVVALEPTRCLVLTNTIFQELILAHPDMAMKMLAELSRRLRQTDRESYAALERRVADRTRELLALYEVTAVASESLDLGATLQQLLERSLEAMGADMGAIQLLDQDSQELKLVAEQGVPFPALEELDCIAPGSGLGDWVIQHTEPVLIADITQHPCVTKALAEQPPQAYLGVPMRAKGKVLGVLGVFRGSDRQFNAEDIALMASIADQVGVVVENARLRQQAEVAAVLAERGRLARDLHDSVTQSLYSVTLFAEAARRLLAEGDTVTSKDYLSELSATSQQALKELRLLVYELRPSLLEQEGLIGALQQRLSTVEERANIEARLVHNGDLTLDKPVELGLYHIAQEALNNALKHASASAVTVRISSSDGSVELEVADNGKGFNPEEIEEKGGMGMISIRERTEMLGGTLKVISSPGQGTSIQVRVGLS